jgi:hypothetical protein
MATYGLGNFQYDIKVEDGNANFNFFDPEDASNTASVSVPQKEFPEGVTQADTREVADLAYAQCQKVLNDKRDARIQKSEEDALAKKQEEDAAAREAAADFHANSNDLADTTPTGSAATEETPAAAPAHKEPAAKAEDQKTKKK